MTSIELALTNLDAILATKEDGDNFIPLKFFYNNPSNFILWNSWGQIIRKSTTANLITPREEQYVIDLLYSDNVNMYYLGLTMVREYIVKYIEYENKRHGHGE
jgi:hypothetical protein